MQILNFLRMRYWPNMDLMDVGIRRENSWISSEVIVESRRRLEELKSDKKSVKEPDFLFHSWLDAGRDQKLSCLQDGKQEEQRRGDGKKGERWIRRGRDRDGRFTKVQREDKRWKWKACQVGQKREREMEDWRRRIIFLLVLFFLQAGGKHCILQNVHEPPYTNSCKCNFFKCLVFSVSTLLWINLDHLVSEWCYIHKLAKPKAFNYSLILQCLHTQHASLYSLLTRS